MTPTRKLRRDLLEEQAHRQALESGIRDLMTHIAGARIRGEETDGSRRDWIGATDVDRRLQATLHEGEQARDLEARYRWAILPAADSVDRLRAIDLRHVLEPLPELNLPGFVDWLVASRPDLAELIRNIKRDLRLSRDHRSPVQGGMEMAR